MLFIKQKERLSMTYKNFEFNGQGGNCN